MLTSRNRRVNGRATLARFDRGQPEDPRHRVSEAVKRRLTEKIREAAANRDPRMGDMYTRYMNLWRDNGGQLNAIYNSVTAFNNDGSLGTKEYQTQPRAEAPKFDAILDFVETTPCWWNGCAR